MSVVWVTLVFATEYRHEAVDFILSTDYERELEFCEETLKGLREAYVAKDKAIFEQTGYYYREDFEPCKKVQRYYHYQSSVSVFPVAISFPLISLILGLGIAWIIRGFRHS